jgi:hypothetical protein
MSNERPIPTGTFGPNADGSPVGYFTLEGVLVPMYALKVVGNLDDTTDFVAMGYLHAGKWTDGAQGETMKEIGLLMKVNTAVISTPA